MPPLFLFIVTSLIWGSTWFAIIKQLGVVNPSVSITYRFAIAAIILLLWCVWRKEQLRFNWRQHLGIAAQGALLFCINYLTIYNAELYVSSGLVAVIFSMLAVFNIIFARIIYRTPIKAAAALASLLGVAGVAMMFWPEITDLDTHSLVLFGIALAVLGTVSASGGNMVALYNNRSISVVASSAWGMVYGTLYCALFAVANGATWNFDPSAAYVISLLYLAVFGTVFAFMSYLTLLAKAGAGKAGYVHVVTPAIALLLSTLFENYQWSVPAFIGLGLVLVGNVLLLRR